MPTDDVNDQCDLYPFPKLLSRLFLHDCKDTGLVALNRSGRFEPVRPLTGHRDAREPVATRPVNKKRT